jgi:hypothetical protein
VLHLICAVGRPLLLPACLFAIPCSLYAQDTNQQLPAKLGGWSFSALGDGYFTFNFNHPVSGSNQLQNFDLNYAGFGETMRFIHASDPAPRGFRYVEQMYVIAKPKYVHGTEFDFGEFVTSAGAEVIESSSNWNYSRSLLFVLATPYYHFGVRASVPVTKSYTVGVQIVNAWNTLWRR